MHLLQRPIEIKYNYKNGPLRPELLYGYFQRIKSNIMPGQKQRTLNSKRARKFPGLWFGSPKY